MLLVGSPGSSKFNLKVKQQQEKFFAERRPSRSGLWGECGLGFGRYCCMTACLPLLYYPKGPTTQIIGF